MKAFGQGINMEEFLITWEVTYDGMDEADVTFPEDIIDLSPATYYTKEWYEAEDFDSLYNHLNEHGVEHTPEMNVPFHDGDFNIEWVLVQDKDNKEVHRDEDFTTAISDIPYE